MEFFIKVINHCGIRLSELEDEKVWSWNVSTGWVSAKLAYEAISLSYEDYVDKWWHKSLWKWNAPLKLKCLC